MPMTKICWRDDRRRWTRLGDDDAVRALVIRGAGQAFPGRGRHQLAEPAVAAGTAEENLRRLDHHGALQQDAERVAEADASR